MGKFQDLTGKRFGRLVVIRKIRFKHNNKIGWFSQCDCGNTLNSRSNDLLAGISVGCGCMSGSNVRRHGDAGTRIYQIWLCMLQRCYNPKDKGYPRYGGRGIQVCKEWKDDYRNFKNDMYSTYTDKLTIERIDNDKGYCKENCRWATMKEQCNNRRNSIKIIVDKTVLTVAEAATKYGVSEGIIRDRLRRQVTKENLFKPAQDSKFKPRRIAAL